MYKSRHNRTWVGLFVSSHPAPTVLRQSSLSEAHFGRLRTLATCALLSLSVWLRPAAVESASWHQVHTATQSAGEDPRLLYTSLPSVLDLLHLERLE